ncbi:MAG: hypothetical protein QXW98_06560 [Candidatus Caldarchaeum sp.]
MQLLTLLNNEGWIKAFHDIHTVTLMKPAGLPCVVKIEDNGMLFGMLHPQDENSIGEHLLISWREMMQLTQVLNRVAGRSGVAPGKVWESLLRGEFTLTSSGQGESSGGGSIQASPVEKNGAPTAKRDVGDHHVQDPE